MRSLVGAVAAFALAAGACQTTPRDPFAAGEQALLRSDLPSALQQFDAVPVAHPRYPEARAAAAGVERRMRRSHENLLDGLLLRSEWRDREALGALQRARDIWPALPGISVLIQATEQRLALFAAPDVAASAAAVAEPTLAPVPLPGPGEVRVPELAVAPPPVAAVAVAVAPTPEAEPAARLHDDAVARALIDVEARLASGELEAAVAELQALSERFPREARVRVRLVRVLHQRALLRYGQGALAAAITDWERVIGLEPGHAVARSLLDAARAEAAGSPSPGR